MKKCEKCTIWDSQQKICLRFRAPMDASDFCSKFASSPLAQCQCCGQYILPGSQVLLCEDEVLITLCPNCASHTSECGTCLIARQCRFRTDPVNIPHTIQKQIRQGSMVAVTEIKNPERIEKTCKEGCTCWSEENGCLRESIGSCQEWRIK